MLDFENYLFDSVLNILPFSNSQKKKVKLWAEKFIKENDKTPYLIIDGDFHYFADNLQSVSEMSMVRSCNKSSGDSNIYIITFGTDDDMCVITIEPGYFKLGDKKVNEEKIYETRIDAFEKTDLFLKIFDAFTDALVEDGRLWKLNI